MAYHSAHPLFRSLDDEEERQFRLSVHQDPDSIKRLILAGTWITAHPVCRMEFILLTLREHARAALAIIEGAVNPKAMATNLHEAIFAAQEIPSEEVRLDAATEPHGSIMEQNKRRKALAPARLMLVQLAHIIGVGWEGEYALFGQDLATVKQLAQATFATEEQNP